MDRRAVFLLQLYVQAFCINFPHRKCIDTIKSLLSSLPKYRLQSQKCKSPERTVVQLQILCLKGGNINKSPSTGGRCDKSHLSHSQLKNTGIKRTFEGSYIKPMKIPSGKGNIGTTPESWLRQMVPDNSLRILPAQGLDKN